MNHSQVRKYGLFCSPDLKELQGFIFLENLTSAFLKQTFEGEEIWGRGRISTSSVCSYFKSDAEVNGEAVAIMPCYKSAVQAVRGQGFSLSYP